jgi:hypothetical protein
VKLAIDYFAQWRTTRASLVELTMRGLVLALFSRAAYPASVSVGREDARTRQIETATAKTTTKTV